MVLVFVIALLVLLLTPLTGLVGYPPWPYTVSTYLLVGPLLVGWPIWRDLAPRPIRALRALAGAAGTFGACVALACMTGDLAPEAYGLVLHAFGVVALALYAEIARALRDRRDHRSELVPEMRARVRRSGSSIDAPVSLPPS
jgi:hypothetical protein